MVRMIPLLRYIKKFRSSCNHRRFDRALLARSHRPVGCDAERVILDARMALAALRDEQCTCEHLPAWLCTVTWCWTSAAGYECAERAGEEPGQCECDCMALPLTRRLDGSWFCNHLPALRPRPGQHGHPTRSCQSPKKDWWDFNGKVDPPPGGYVGRGFCAEIAGATLTCAEVERLQQGLVEPGFPSRSMWLERRHPRFGLPPRV